MRVYHDFNWSMLVHFMTNWTFEVGNKIGEKNNYEVWRNPASEKMRFDYKVYREYLEDMKKCGVNTIVIDVGDALKYKSHPEIALEDAFTYEEMERELDYMSEMGFELIPKLNFSTAHDVWMKEYSRMVSSKKYYEVVKDLIDEVIELFKPRYFHIGMDEETYDGQGGYDYVVVRRNDLWWNDLYYYVNCIEKHGVRAMMWSDYAREKPEEFIEKCPRSVVQCVWYYFNKYGDNVEERFKIRTRPLLLLDQAGFDQLPTGSVDFDKDALPLLADYCKKRLNKDRLLGFMQTTWDPVLPDWQEELSEGARRLQEARAIYEA